MRRALFAGVFFAVCGCQAPGGSVPKRFYLPPEMRPHAEVPGRQEKATVRMAENGRVWEAELPVGQGPYAMTVPLNVDETKPPSLGGVDAATEAHVQHYLIGVAQVKELYSTGRAELALVVLDDLVAKYPEDGRLWTMKGSLHKRLGQTVPARTAWKKALELSPEDPDVAEALRALELEGGE